MDKAALSTSGDWIEQTTAGSVATVKWESMNMILRSLPPKSNQRQSRSIVVKRFREETIPDPEAIKSALQGKGHSMARRNGIAHCSYKGSILGEHPCSPVNHKPDGLINREAQQWKTYRIILLPIIPGMHIITLKDGN